MLLSALGVVVFWVFQKFDKALDRILEEKLPALANKESLRQLEMSWTQKEQRLSEDIRELQRELLSCRTRGPTQLARPQSPSTTDSEVENAASQRRVPDSPSYQYKEMRMQLQFVHTKEKEKFDPYPSLEMKNAMLSDNSGIGKEKV